MKSNFNPPNVSLWPIAALLEAVIRLKAIVEYTAESGYAGF